MVSLFPKKLLLSFVVAWVGTGLFSIPITLANPPESKIFVLPLLVDGSEFLASKAYISFPYKPLNIPVKELATGKRTESEQALNLFLKNVRENDYASASPRIFSTGFKNEKAKKQVFENYAKQMSKFKYAKVIGKIYLGKDDVRFLLLGNDGRRAMRYIPFYRMKNGKLGVRMAWRSHPWEKLILSVFHMQIRQPGLFPYQDGSVFSSEPESVFQEFSDPHLKHQFSRNTGAAFLNDRFDPSLETKKIPVFFHFQGKVINGNVLDERAMASNPYLSFFRRAHLVAREGKLRELSELFTPGSRPNSKNKREAMGKRISQQGHVIFFINAEPFGIVFTAEKPVNKLSDIDNLHLDNFYIHRMREQEFKMASYKRNQEYLFTNFKMVWGMQRILTEASKGRPFFDEVIAPELKKQFKK